MLAGGCGSSNDTKKRQGDEAGAAGANEGGGPSSGGSQSAPAGAAGEPDVGTAGAEAGGAPGGGGAPGAAGAPASAGQPSDGGAPSLPNCDVDGSVTGLALLTEPIYQGCRGSRVAVPYDVTTSSNSFHCCGVSTSKPAYGVPLAAESNQDGGGDLWFEVPADAPLGSYAMNVTCVESGQRVFALEINDAAPPVVTNAPTITSAGATFTITGENLDTVTSITAFRLRDAAFAFCNIDGASQSATSVSCTFSAITKSTDANDFYVLDVSNDTCGAALNRPQFTVEVLTR